MGAEAVAVGLDFLYGGLVLDGVVLICFIRISGIHAGRGASVGLE